MVSTPFPKGPSHSCILCVLIGDSRVAVLPEAGEDGQDAASLFASQDLGLMVG